MKLMTKEIEKKLEKHPFHSQEEKGMDAEVIVKFFNPYGSATWLITEGEKDDEGNWLLFGYCYIFDWEWGYIDFNELKDIRVNVFGTKLPMERDIYCTGETVRECIG